MTPRKSWSVSLAFLASTVVAYADVAFSNLAPTEPRFDTTQRYFGGFDDADETSPVIQLGFRFISEATGPLESITVALSEQAPNSNAPAAFDLYADADGQLGERLWSLDTSVSVNGTTPALYTGPAETSVTLESGKAYWLVVRTLDSEPFWWYYNSSGVTGTMLMKSPSVPSVYTEGAVQGAFEVNVVPEPATLAALGIGALALLRRRSRSQARRER